MIKGSYEMSMIVIELDIFFLLLNSHVLVEECGGVNICEFYFFTLHCSSLSYMNEYLPIENGGYLYVQPSHIN